MIAVDTSALMAVVLNEAAADDCIGALEDQVQVLISAGTVAEALIVSARRRVQREMVDLIDEYGFEVLPVTRSIALQIGAAYEKWGKGRHAAELNMGDCFAYVVAKENDCPLLFVGKDFSRTDVISVL